MVSKRRLISLATSGGLLIMVGLIVWAVAFRQGSAKNLDRLNVQGKLYFWAGVNYPWHSYQDFGTGIWGHSGVSQPTSYAEIDTDFANMAAQGVKVVKWRIFNDGRYSPEFDDRGYVTGLDEKFFDDIDAAIEIARKHDLYLVFGLLASGLWTTECQANGMQLGVGPGIIADAGKRKSLVDKAIVPLLKHLGKNDRVLAYEIIAEPEWGIDELRDPEGNRLTAPLAAVRELVRDGVKAVHAYTRAYATLQSNRPTNMQHWRGLGLDYYSFSWYDWMEPYDPLDTAAASYKLDKPVVIGEVPVSGSQYYEVLQALDIAHERGYAGAFAWSFTGSDKYSQWSSVAKSYTEWISRLWSEVDVSGKSSPPTPGAPLKPQPYVGLGPDLSVDENVVDINAGVQIREGGVYVVKFYLYEFGGNPPGTELQEITRFKNGERQEFSLSFPNLIEGQRYKLSMAIFSSSLNLLKWVDSYAVFEVKDGQVEIPNLSDEVVGNPCSK